MSALYTNAIIDKWANIGAVFWATVCWTRLCNRSTLIRYLPSTSVTRISQHRDLSQLVSLLCYMTKNLHLIVFYYRYKKILTQLTWIWRASVLQNHQKRRCHVWIGLPCLQTYGIGYYSDQNWRMQGQIASGDGVHVESQQVPTAHSAVGLDPYTVQLLQQWACS